MKLYTIERDENGLPVRLVGGAKRGRPAGSVTRHAASRAVPAYGFARDWSACTVGENIKRERERVNVSAEELAARLGLCTHAVLHWERGTRCPPLGQIVRVAWALGCRVDALMEGLL